MKRTLTVLPPDIPQQFLRFAKDSAIFDSSCSEDARVWFLDKGFYLKKASKGALAKEAAMYSFFHSKGLAPEVLAYESLENDWLLTASAQGEDCTDSVYLSDPKRLCETTATLLRELHETDFTGCPVADRTKDYLATVAQNYHLGHFDTSLFPNRISAEEAWKIAEENGKYLQTDTLLHGDYCLPNIMLDSWDFSSFIDLGCGGVGDRHIDLFWGVWTLEFNLKTNKYADRFLDAYGRDKVNPDIFPVIAACEVFG
ncbi:MAG: aminoglycoside 3'-phosphotransferase [Oscillospiraceae bacterium]|nr:aminoglycoside 3'-phosphotransferase [Oscillospiraceae bacterium]